MLVLRDVSSERGADLSALGWELRIGAGLKNKGPHGKTCGPLWGWFIGLKLG